MARRYNLTSKPYEVVSVVSARGKPSRSYSETFDKEADARKRAEKAAKEKNVRSVYLRTLDSEGEIVSTETIKKYTPPAVED
jgi:hypothetical protein